MTCGIYLISCNEIKYVGQSENIEKRWKLHVYQLNKSVHGNTYMQRLWDKYSDYFCFSILEEVKNKEELNNREIYWIDKLETLNFGNNITGMNIREGGNSYGLSEETKKKISLKAIGRIVGEETRKLLSSQRQGKDNNFYGKNHTQETCKNMSQSRLGRKLKNGKSSNYHGVSITPYGTWKSSTTLNGEKIHIGTFKKEVDAAHAYNDFVIKNNLPNPLNILQ